MTIFGFDAAKEEFYVYDSMEEKHADFNGLTIDKNSQLPGNATLSESKLLDFWSKGGMYGLYKWYAIVADI